uniref:Uncharacterized protein n=1 Tax=Nelumbo nucifera TaxID=4432 RepID=A0A822XP51_NELNU|nr:TPA_asm: hypothetical protein HUJ06_023275 [Nelumbo nucifera]
MVYSHSNNSSVVCRDKHPCTPARDYNILGSKASKIFTTIGAAANLVFSFNQECFQRYRYPPPKKKKKKKKKKYTHIQISNGLK